MLARITVARRISRLAATSMRYSSSFNEGSVAQSKEFSKKEKAHEDQYVRKHEQELLAKLRKEIERKNQELADLQKEEDKLLTQAQEVAKKN